MEPKVASYEIAKRLHQAGIKIKTDYYWCDTLRGERKLVASFGERDVLTRYLESCEVYKYPACNVGELLHAVSRKYLINPYITDKDLVAKLGFFTALYEMGELRAMAKHVDLIARHLLIVLHKKMLIKN